MRYILDENDEKMLRQWEAEIDANVRLITDVKEGRQPMPIGRRGEFFKALLRKNPTAEQITLFSIGDVLSREGRYERCATSMRQIAKVLVGGTQNVTQIGRNRGKWADTCLDHAVLVKILADRYGIPGAVGMLEPLRGGYHAYWIQFTPNGLGSIVDLIYERRLRGFCFGPNSYPLGDLTKDNRVIEEYRKCQQERGWTGVDPDKLFDGVQDELRKRARAAGIPSCAEVPPLPGARERR